MLSRRDATEVLDRDFLEARCKILELAATLDRIDRAPARHGEHPDSRLGQLRQALEALVEPGPGPRRDDPADLLAGIRPGLAPAPERAPIPTQPSMR